MWVRQTVGSGKITGIGFEEVDVDLAAGADQVSIYPLVGTDVTLVDVNAGQIVTTTGQFQLISDPDNPNGLVKQPIVNITPDNAGDTITIFGNDGGADTFTVSARRPGLRPHDRRPASCTSATPPCSSRSRSGPRATASSSTAGAGNDPIDASALGGDGTPTVFPDLIAVTLKGGAGDDVLIGSPFDDALDGGTGNDRLTGGPGLDTFLDGSLPGSGDTDTLVETLRPRHVALPGHVHRRAAPLERRLDALLASRATSARPDIRVAHDDRRQPELPQRPDDGDHYAAGATVESLSGIFEAAILTGGTLEQHDRRQRQRQHRLHRRRRAAGHAVAGPRDPRQRRQLDRRDAQRLAGALRDHDRRGQPRADRHRRLGRRLGQRRARHLRHRTATTSR